MKTLEISMNTLSELPDAAIGTLKFSEGRKIFAFYGEMGSGKTTLIKEICSQLGSNDNFSSPTYSIINEYSVAQKQSNSKLYHIDCYRLKNLTEALNIGIEEYLNSENYCFIEWPELLEPLLPEDVVKISVNPDGDIRNLSIFTK